MEIDLDKRHQTLIVLWFGLLVSVGLYFLVAQFAAPAINLERSNPPSTMLIIALTALGTFLVVLSFVVKRKLLNRSVSTQDVAMVQKALVVACAMCEVSALLGLIERFTIGSREYYWLFLLAATGIAFHFPRRTDLESASYKKRGELS